MNWVRFVSAVLAAGLASSTNDWLLAGSLVHDKYNVYPEVWLYTGGTGERKAVVWSIAVGLFASAAFILIVVGFRVQDWRPTLPLGLPVWAAAALPVLFTSAFFIKLHPLVVVSNAVGWLVKFALAASSAVMIIHETWLLVRRYPCAA